MNTEAELSAAVIAAQRRDWARTMTVGSRACDLRVQLGRQPTAPVELNRGVRRRRRDGDGANRYGRRGISVSLAETLRQRGNRVVTNKQCGIRFVFLVMTNTWAIGRRVSYYGAGFS